jgi:nucleotide-binding universal stress UspA family protein
MQVSIKKIVLATDFSDIAKHASSHALLLARTSKAELKVLHVFDTSAWSIPAHDYLAADAIIEGLEEAIQRGRDSLKKLAESFDQKVETIFREGDPVHEIIRVAEEENTDLIVLGTHGYKGWKRFTMGSVAELVVRNAPCAVLTVRPKGK